MGGQRNQESSRRRNTETVDLAETLNTSKKKKKKSRREMKGALARLQLGESHQLSFPPSSKLSSSNSSRFQNLLDSGAADAILPSSSPLGTDLDPNFDDRDFILSQDFFCTPDYITPDNQHTLNGWDCNKENIPCPKSPEKSNTVKSKRRRQGDVLLNPLSPTFSGNQQIVELGTDSFGIDEAKIEKPTVTEVRKTQNYVSQSAVALRCRVMPPPCFKNPYLKDASEMDIDPLGNQRSNVLQIGSGYFSHVFKALNRIDGCLYAVKLSMKQLHQDTERRKALMEVPMKILLDTTRLGLKMSSSTFRWNYAITAYPSTNFPEPSQGRDFRSLVSDCKGVAVYTQKGIAHLDVKPDNIYVKNGVYKLGDFGCATLLDKSLPIEEGDARYMPQEILNEKYDDLDKADIFSWELPFMSLLEGGKIATPSWSFAAISELTQGVSYKTSG
ncbi:hypothetical protein Prudu_023144 [Prunus dulcis]|uniref:Protein kinase domain-containing protein n=1 Tax=Prunus dulcis TaxID=3755 RepID=A0A4Y1S228_PRUDU|nr:hypothetical protein Prudu_023144 [Prunus dulcis]